MHIKREQLSCSLLEFRLGLEVLPHLWLLFPDNHHVEIHKATPEKKKPSPITRLVIFFLQI